MTTVNSASIDNTDQRLHALLHRYRCPLPFHAARAQLLGAFASPAGGASSRQALAGLWGKSAPDFVSGAERDGEIELLLDGLADRLARCCSEGEPFKLLAVETHPTREALGRLALIRREEIDAFVNGLFGNNEAIELTDPAQAALDSIAHIRALLQHLRNFLDDPAKRTSPEGLASSLASVRELMPPLEEAMNKIVSQCSAVRRQGGSTQPAAGSAQVLH